MNREIKFRAWDGENMHYDIVPWRHDFVISLMSHKCVQSNGSGILGSGGTRGTFEVPGISFKVIMQFTGLKDKNGKEIYEGDVVELRRRRSNPEAMTEDDYDHFYTRGIVDFSSACFWINGGGYSELQHFHFNESDREVIGNIHEHADLLKP